MKTDDSSLMQYCLLSHSTFHEDGETNIIFRRTESDLYVYPWQRKRNDHLGMLFPPYLHASIIAFGETVSVFEIPPWVILLAETEKETWILFH